MGYGLADHRSSALMAWSCSNDSVLLDAPAPHPKKPGLVIRANFFRIKYRRAESNCRPEDYESAAPII